MDLGLERAGFQVKWQVEIDEYASKVLEKHWPDVTRFRDVRDCGSNNLETVDLIAGGFPCQDISAANSNSVGISGTRSGLWREFARIVCELKPQFALVENVARLLTINGGRDFGAILSDLDSFGYNAEWEVLPACAFGASHLRNRIFILATRQEMVHTNGTRLEGLHEKSYRKYLQSIAGDLSRYTRDTTPRVCRKGDGIPHRVDRLRGLGNAVVPQVAEYIGRRIIAMARSQEAY